MSICHVVLGASGQYDIPLNVKEDDFLVGVDRGALYLINKGLTPDLAIGDFDSISEFEFKEVKIKSKKLIQAVPEKDDTDAELALSHLSKEHSDASRYVIYNYRGGRLDHFISLLYLGYQERFNNIIDRVLFKDAKNQIHYFLPGDHEIEKEDGMKYLSFISMTPIRSLRLKNVKYELDGKDYPHPRALISNEFIDRRAEFSFKEGMLLAVQSKD